MNRSPKARRPGPPHNPGVHDLIAGKRRWSSPAKLEDQRQGFRGWHERGYLPHRDHPGLMQFVSFRLTDSFPEYLRSEWEHLWRIENDRQRRIELEAYLDKGRGECHLRRPEIARLVESAVRKFHGTRYDLRSWIVMPNHVHALFKVQAVPLGEIVETWKKYTAARANKLLLRRGAFWQADYWDTFMRSDADELRVRRYIENNPVKAGFVLEPKEWPWSSARLRDRFGTLRL